MARHGWRSRGLGFSALVVVLVLLFFVFLFWDSKMPVRVTVPRTMVIYCFSGADSVMERGILPAFRRLWLEKTGEEVEFITTFAGSGAIIEKILRRFPAEVAVLSSEIDVNRLTERGFYVPRKDLPHGGFVSASPIVIITRPGNPFGIRDYADLSNPDLTLLQADPVTSGVGEWSLLSVYGSALLESGEPPAAEKALKAYWANISAKASSARELRDRFERGEGDALVTYESEVGRAEPLSGEVIYPLRSILSQHCVAKIAKNVKAENEKLVDGFLEFLWSEEAQKIFVEFGFRSVQEEWNAGMVTRGQTFTLEALGGARQARYQVLDSVWQSGIIRQGARETP